MVIGLMGGVGSGKSTVLNYLEDSYCAYIIQSDHVAKEIMEPGREAFKSIANIFPEVIIDGEINSQKLGEIVFNDRDKLKLLNSITHPATIKEIINRIDGSDNNIIVVESALLMGTGIEEKCDKIWFVYCEKEKRINRLMESRGYSREKAEGIINNQPLEEEYKAQSDEFIDNTYSVENTKAQIDALLSTLPCSF